jgi:peptidyl-prolyl cis-trans isomerase SurA
MEDKVWNQAIQDTVGLREFYLQHRDSYRWDTRVEATVFNMVDESALGEVERFLDMGYFTYQKYDFSGSGQNFNKAQDRILGAVAQVLQQGQQCQLVMEFDTSMVENIKTRQAIDAFLNTNNVDAGNIVIHHLPEGRQGFLLYVTSSSLDDLEENMNQKNPLTIQIESGRYQKGENQVLDKVKWEKGIHKLEVDGRKVLVQIAEIIPKGFQELEEIKGQVISDYQTHLEAKWVAELKDKYQVIIHEKTLEKIYKQYNL